MLCASPFVLCASGSVVLRSGSQLLRRAGLLQQLLPSALLPQALLPSPLLPSDLLQHLCCSFVLCACGPKLLRPGSQLLRCPDVLQ